MRGSKANRQRHTAADKHITISVAEYVFLTKAATMLEMVLNDPTYSNSAVLKAAKATMLGATIRPEGGADA